MSDDSDDEGDWYNSPAGRRSRIPSDVLARIEGAGWKINKSSKTDAYINDVDEHVNVELIDDLDTAGIKYRFLNPVSDKPRKLLINVKDLNDLVPDWRDISYPAELMEEIANADWKRPGHNMTEAYVNCADAGEFQHLKDLLDKAGFEYTADDPKESGKPDVVKIRIDDLDELAPAWRKASVSEGLIEQVLGAGWKFSPPSRYDSKPAKEVNIDVNTAGELRAMINKLEKAKIYYIRSQSEAPCNITVWAEDLDHLGTDWREAAILPEVKEHIMKSKWQIEDENAVYYSKFGSDTDEMLKNLKQAGIKYQIGRTSSGQSNGLVTVSLEEMEKAIPNWREKKEARDLEEAPLLIKEDAVSRGWKGRRWEEGHDPYQAIIFCQDKDDATALVELLATANITARRQGGKIVVTSAEALRDIGIDVKTAESAVAPEDAQKTEAREWLNDRVKWATPEESSPLALATFKNGNLVDITIEHLLTLNCIKDLKRLPDKKGLMLVVNAETLKAAVPEVNIEPFKHTRETDKGDDEVCTGR